MNELGRLNGDGRLTFVRVFRAPVDTVWAHLVEDEHRRKWFCGGDVEPRTGGRIVFDFDHSRLSDSPAPKTGDCGEAVRFEGEVLAWEPPEHLSFSWPEGEGGMSSRVSITLKAVSEGTELCLIHENLLSDSLKVNVAAGWHTHFDLLGDLLDGRAVRDFWIRHAEAEVVYERELR